MKQLGSVNLEKNSLEGPIPDLSNCTNLQQLMLGDNKLTGEVPPSLMNLPSLTHVSLENNWLQGPMPLFKTITWNVTLEGNGFCLDHPGPCHRTVSTLLQVAQAFGYPLLLARTWRGNSPCKGWSFITCDNQDKIRTVNLTKLNLNGTISPAFGNLTDLRELYLSGNNIKGSIPESLTTLSQLKILDVSHNILSGAIPRFSLGIMLNTANNNVFLTEHSPPKASPPHPSKASPTASTTTHHYWIKLGAGSAACVVGVLGVIIFICRKRCFNLVLKITVRTERKHADHHFENLIQRYGSLSLQRYTYKEVKKMTNSFKEKLGEGGYGIVYKASLADSQQVAIKILKESKGSLEEFVDENILLDKHFHPKIADFGLAKICKKDQNIVFMAGTREIPGYIAPEVFSRAYGKVSHKSDVYSYGMLILEIIGERQNYYKIVESQASQICFPDWIYKDIEQGGPPGASVALALDPFANSLCVVSDNELLGEEAAYMKKLRKAISPVPANWFTAPNMCDWSNVLCTEGVLSRTVESINLEGKSLKGELPPGLNNSLPNLKTLVLTNNSLTGPLPSFAGLSNLQELKLGFNKFISVPDGCFQGLTSLQEFHFHNNTNLSPWTFPATLSASSKLNILDQDSSNLMGFLPDIFDSLSDLEILDLSSNNLTGILPNSFSKLLNLKRLYLFSDDQHRFSGKIGFLSSMTHLESLWLQGNSFQGPIPD
ncbi:hypothetical protein PIB30_025757 [Stylosanthes scabra]|uniref:Protein kinase domain-containing protein n=1 Tax=Stylosanthes scabra TaxID=79078 RepID=A0ABU6RAF7_9FABA|nr:hypothetical protein [Stylosanthes scabra]